MTGRGPAWLAALALAACPAPRPASRPPPLPLESAAHHDEFALAGVVHVVRRGETVWRIARAYGIDPGDLMETNGIADPRSVEVGAELFVPGAARAVDVPPTSGGESADTLGREALHPERRTSTSTPTSTSTSTSTPTPTSTSTPTPTSTATATATPTATAARGGAIALAWPLKGVLYGRYGVRAGKRHDGIDIAAPEGTPVLAAAAGTVIYAGEQAGYGAIVILKHEGGLVTLYAHNARLLVAEGARVGKGEAIARVGQTGRTTGPHLHFEVRDGTRPRNPLLFLP
ncbi:MAG TPA: M23 family metallopeptidase [Anaeromyxobacter sp.]